MLSRRFRKSVRVRELTFCPNLIRAGEYHFSVGTAGSCMLVLQTVLPALLMADDQSSITLEGGHTIRLHHPLIFWIAVF